MLKRILFNTITLFCINNCLLAGTKVTGSQSGVWTKAKSPYYVNGNIVVNTGTALIIEPGVIIKFNGNFSIDVHGALIAKCPASNRIDFTSINDNEFGDQERVSTIVPMASDWQYIKFYNDSNDGRCVLENCVIRYANEAIICESAFPMIKGVYIADAGRDNILINGNLVGIQPGPVDYLLQGQVTEPVVTNVSNSNVPIEDIVGDSPVDEFSFGEIKVIVKRNPTISSITTLPGSGFFQCLAPMSEA